MNSSVHPTILASLSSVIPTLPPVPADFMRLGTDFDYDASVAMALARQALNAQDRHDARDYCQLARIYWYAAFPMD